MKILKVIFLTTAILLGIIYIVILFYFRILHPDEKGLSKVDIKYLNIIFFIIESILLSFYTIFRLNSK